MEFVPYRLLRNQPGDLRKRLEEKGELVVTVDGEPLAVMLKIPEGSLEDLVLLVSQVKAQLALSAIRKNARQRGLNKMSMKEIDALIRETRAQRNPKRSE